MQQKKSASGSVAGILLPMGLVCLFAFCSLALALMGGQAYRQIQSSVDDSYDTTVAASYLRTKLSQNNQSGAVQLREENGVQLLVIQSKSNDVLYETRIYMKDGRLMENFERADVPFAPVDGVMIAELASCRFALDEGLFTAEMESRAGTSTSTAFAVTQGGVV